MSAVAPLRMLRERPLLANTAALVAMRATNLAARLALLFLLARHVDPASFGLVVFALSVAEIAKVVADFGMDTLAIREYAIERPPGHWTRFAASLAGAKLVFGLVVYAALAGWLLATRSRAQAELGLVVGLTALTALAINFAIDWYQARLRVGRVIVPVVASNVALVALAALLVPRLPGLHVLAALFPAFELVNGLVLLAALRAEGLVGRPAIAFDRLGDLVRGALPIAATGVLIMVYSRLDVLVLSSRLDAAAVGLYGVAFRLTEPVQMAAAAFGLSVLSRFAAWFHAPAGVSLRAAALRYALFTLAVGAAAAAVLAIAAPPLVARFLPAYADAGPILRVLAASLVFRSLNATLAGILQGAGRFRLLTGIALWNVAATWACLQWFVPREGALGAALALLSVEGVNSLLQAGMVARVVAAHGRSQAHAQ